MNSLAQSFSNYNQRLAPAPLDAENVFLGVMVRQAHQPCLALPDSTSWWHHPYKGKHNTTLCAKIHTIKALIKQKFLPF